MKLFGRYQPIWWLILVVSIVAMGCSEDHAEQIDDPFQGIEIAIAIPADLGLKAAWQPILDEWSAQTGATCTVHEYASIDASTVEADDKRWSLLCDGDGNRLASVKPGLIVFPRTRLTQLNELNLLAPIPEDVQGESNLQWLGLFAGLRDRVTMTRNDPNFSVKQPVALPISDAAFVCYYRKDLLEKSGLQPPQTWKDYEALVFSLQDWANGLSAVEPWGESYRTTMFLARAVSSAKHPANYSLFLDIQSGEPLIDRPSFVQALEQAKQAVKKMPANVLQYNPADCRRELFAGRAALAIAFETGPGNPSLPFGPGSGGQPETQADSTRADDIEIGICRLPGAAQVYNCSTSEWSNPTDGEVSHATLCGFGGLCVAVSAFASETQAQAAWNLLAMIVVENVNSAFPHATKSLCRQTQRDIAAVWLGDELTIDERQKYIDVITQSLNDRAVVSELPVLKRGQFRAALTDAISEVLTSEKPPKEALADAASKWSEIVGDKEDADELINSYRHSLGLPPLVSFGGNP